MLNFWIRVRDRLDYLGFSQKELAKQIQESYNTLQSWTSKNRLPNAETAVRIAQALHVSVEYLVTGTDPSFSPAVKNSVVPLIKKLNSLSDSDLHFFAEVLDRLTT